MLFGHMEKKTYRYMILEIKYIDFIIVLSLSISNRTIHCTLKHMKKHRTLTLIIVFRLCFQLGHTKLIVCVPFHCISKERSYSCVPNKRSWMLIYFLHFCPAWMLLFGPELLSKFCEDQHCDLCKQTKKCSEAWNLLQNTKYLNHFLFGLLN